MQKEKKVLKINARNERAEKKEWSCEMAVGCDLRESIERSTSYIEKVEVR